MFFYRDVVTTGSVLHIDQDFDESDNLVSHQTDHKCVDIIGEPVSDFTAFSKKMVPVDSQGLVKKKILDEGGGLPLHEGCTVSIAYSGYFENQPEPFDVVPINKPMVSVILDSTYLNINRIDLQNLIMNMNIEV